MLFAVFAGERVVSACQRVATEDLSGAGQEGDKNKRKGGGVA